MLPGTKLNRESSWSTVIMCGLLSPFNRIAGKMIEWQRRDHRGRVPLAVERWRRGCISRTHDINITQWEWSAFSGDVTAGQSEAGGLMLQWRMSASEKTSLESKRCFMHATWTAVPLSFSSTNRFHWPSSFCFVAQLFRRHALNWSLLWGFTSFWILFSKCWFIH